MFAVTRFEIESSRFENGQLLVTGKGLAGERIEDALIMQPHGSASRPKKGSTGFILSMPGKRTQSIVMGVEDAGTRPDIGDGDATLYDQHGAGAGIRLAADGVMFDFASRAITMTGGTWTITGNATFNGDVTINGALHATGGITSDAPDGADE